MISTRFDQIIFRIIAALPYFLPARCYASAVLAMALCLRVCVSVSVCHKSVFYQNFLTDRADFWHGCFIRHCAVRKFWHLQQ